MVFNFSGTFNFLDILNIQDTLINQSADSNLEDADVQFDDVCTLFFTSVRYILRWDTYV